MRVSARLILTLLTIWALDGCTEPRSQVSEVSVTVQRAEPVGTWRVRYDLHEPAGGLVFARQRNQFRSSTWVSLDDHYRVAIVGGQEAVVADAPTTSFEFFVRPYNGDTVKDYEFFVEYAGGGTLVYTGYLIASPVNCPEGCSRSSSVGFFHPTRMTYKFLAGAGEHVLTGGPPVNSDPIHDEEFGKFVYVGPLSPVHLSGYWLLMDPRLPAWMKIEIKSLLPPLLDFYARVLGFNLAVEPIVFASYDRRGAGLFQRGGVVPGQVGLSFGGSAWSGQTDLLVRQLRSLTAHEVSHLWNGDLFRNSGQDPETWLHEGGAEAFSARALKDLHLLRDRDFRDLHTEAMNDCSLGLDGVSVRESAGVRRFQNFYSCGMIAALITEHLVRGSDLFAFWKTLFQASLPGHIYGTASYFEVLRAQTDDPEGLALLRDFIFNSHRAPDRFLFEILNRVGVPVTTTDEVPEWFTDARNAELLTHVVNGICPGSEVIPGGVAYQVRTFGPCPALTDGDFLQAVNGENLYFLRDSLWDEVQESCAARGRLTLEFYSGHSVESAACGDLPPLPEYLIW